MSAWRERREGFGCETPDARRAVASHVSRLAPLASHVSRLTKGGGR